VSENAELSMSLPLDDEGFLRRECPTCEREFKWLSSSSEDTGEDEVDATALDGYFCPYCGVQAAPDAWWTKPQLERMKAIVYDEVVGPELEKFKSSISRMGSGFIKASVDITRPDSPAELSEEVNDMRQIDFSCHPDEPVKVLEAWTDQVYCTQRQGGLSHRRTPASPC
jgi:hypothetical protein